MMASIDIPRRDSIRKKDEQLLATLGYKQEFKRAFTPLEVIDFWSRYPKFWLNLPRSLVSPSLSLDYCPPLRQSFSMPSQMAEAQRWYGGWVTSYMSLDIVDSFISGWWRVYSYCSLALPWPSLRQLLQLLAVYVWFKILLFIWFWIQN